MSQQPQENVNLVIGNRINWEYIQGVSVLKYLDSIVKAEGSLSLQQVDKAVQALLGSIPDGYRKRDAKFSKELENCKKKRVIDNRFEWCGIKIGEKTEENQAEETYYDSEELFHVITNHLQRTGVIGKNILTEELVPSIDTFDGMEGELAEVWDEESEEDEDEPRDDKEDSEREETG